MIHTHVQISGWKSIGHRQRHSHSNTAFHCVAVTSPIGMCLPQWNPVNAMPRAVDRFAVGSPATILFIDGRATPSPRPMQTRVASTAGYVKAAAATWHIP